MMIQRTRTPAITALLIVLAVGYFFLVGLRRAGNAADAQLAELQLAIAQPDAKPAAWLKFADKLQQLGRYSRAVVAYQHVLENDPYNRDARLQCALSLALAGNPQEFYVFMQGLLQVDPRLTLNVLQRPEVSTYLAEGRFQSLQREALAQSTD
jgi:tetratricopeptide (TPR) repeat protein